jgi:tetratricopeptide (TPR) repeat protein
MNVKGKLGLMAALCSIFAVSHAAPNGGRAQYEQCLARAASNPNDALNEALGWQKAGGGPPSEHCLAVALVALRRYSEAATRLDELARGGLAADPSMRMQLYDQAGNAWLLANKPDGALASFSAALGIDPADADLLSDRARAHAMKKSWASAESDLSAALLVNPNRADLLVLRGSARHALGRKAEARGDFERALKLHPGFVDALLERGTMRYEAGDAVGARTDWTAVISNAPNGATAAAARQHLADTEPLTAPTSASPAPGDATAPIVLKPPKPH